MDWLVASLVLSVVLTVVLNVVLRAFPGAGESVGRKLHSLAERDGARPEHGGRRVRIWFPWKAMLLASVVLTVLLNLALWLG